MNGLLLATISTSPKSAGLWINETLLNEIMLEGGESKDDPEVALVRVKCVDETGITIDTFHGDTALTYNLDDKLHPERFSKGRIKAEWNTEMQKHGGLYHPVAVEVERIDYGVFLIPHPTVL